MTLATFTYVGCGAKLAGTHVRNSRDCWRSELKHWCEGLWLDQGENEHLGMGYLSRAEGGVCTQLGFYLFPHPSLSKATAFTQSLTPKYNWVHSAPLTPLSSVTVHRPLPRLGHTRGICGLTARWDQNIQTEMLLYLSKGFFLQNFLGIQQSRKLSSGAKEDGSRESKICTFIIKMSFIWTLNPCKLC